MQIVTSCMNINPIKKGFKGVIETKLSSWVPSIYYNTNEPMVYALVIIASWIVHGDLEDITKGSKAYGYELKDLVPSNQQIKEKQWTVLNDNTIAFYFENEFSCDEPIMLIGMLTYNAKPLPVPIEVQVAKTRWNEVEERFVQFLSPSIKHLTKKVRKYEKKSERYQDKILDLEVKILKS